MPATSSALPRPLARASERALGAEAAAKSAAVTAREAVRRAAQKRADLARVIRESAPGSGVTLQELCEAVGERLTLAPRTVKNALYEHPYRADVLSACVDVLAGMRQAEDAR